MKISIKENERGFLMKNGVFLRMLEPGRHYQSAIFGHSVALLEIGDEPLCDERMVAIYSRDENFANATQAVSVADGQIALHFIDGRFRGILETGRHTFWRIFAEHTFQMVDIMNDASVQEIPPYIMEEMPEHICKRVVSEEGYAVLLCIDGKFQRILTPGRHFFWQNGRKIETACYDMRIIQMDVQGQEILTLDKVAIRVNFVCAFRLTDPVKIHAEILDYRSQVYSVTQLALREMLGRMKFDEVLEAKESIADRVLTLLKSREASLHMEFLSAGMKDIVLPGEIRDIMNTVLIAEKRAQANVVSRREEVASTRSLLNTAKLMDENETLYKLKELEYLEKICDKVGSISVGNASGLLGQLAEMVRAPGKSAVIEK